MQSPIKLGAKTVQIEPMTHKTQKAVFKLVTHGLAQQAVLKADATKAVFALLTDQEPKLQPILELLVELPELMTEALALASGESVETLDNATGMQVAKLLEVVILENELNEQLSILKKAGSLLKEAPKQQG